MRCIVGKLVLGFPTRLDTMQAVLLQKLVRALKFLIQELEALFFLCSKI